MAATPDQSPALPQPPQGPGGALALRQAGLLQTHVLGPRADAQTAADDDEIDLRQIWRTFVKHRWMLLGITALCTVAAGIYTLRVTPQYKATALLQIDRAAQKVVGFSTEVQLDEGPASDQLQLRTQVELLKSRSLAERVIDELNLYRDTRSAPLPGQDATAGTALPGDAPAGADAAEEEPGLLAQLGNNLRQLFTPASQDETVLSRSATISAFQEAVTVNPIRNSRLVEIQVLNPDPELAARMANSLVKNFIGANLERKTDSTQYARQYLEEQIRQTKAKVEESERQINEYTRANQILSLGDAGNATTQQYVEFSTALARAEQERIKFETQYNEVKSRPDTAVRVLDNAAIQGYKEQKAKLEAEYAKNLEVYKPEFPTMLQAKSQIDRLQARIDAEIATILASIKGQYDAAVQQETMLRQRAEASRQEVLTVQDRSVDLNLLKRELDTNRQIYDSLLQRLKELSVTADITTNNVSIVDEAKAPLFPDKPRPAINLGLGVLLGLFLGMLAALLREQMDDSIKHADEVEGELGLPLLGLIPMTKLPKGSPQDQVSLLAHTDPRSAFAEAYRSMRTALQFSTADGAPKRFMVTSCGKSEGKTTTALSLAINFAQMGQRVLLIDADMRRPAVHKTLHLPNERGLSNLLSGTTGTDKLIQPSTVPNLSVLTAGPTPPDPVELLMGPKLGLLLDTAEKLGFTQVVIDGPPLLGIADAVVLGNQVQHVVFVVKAAAAKKASIKDSLRRLRHAGVMPMGVALTHARQEHTGYYGYESYYGYGPDTGTDKGSGALVPTGAAASAPRREPVMGQAGAEAPPGRAA